MYFVSPLPIPIFLQLEQNSQNTEYRILETIWAMERTSGQPQVKLSVLHSIFLKFDHWSQSHEETCGSPIRVSTYTTFHRHQWTTDAPLIYNFLRWTNKIERDSATRFSTSGFFSPSSPSVSLSKICGDICISWYTIGVIDTGGKWKKSSIRKALICLQCSWKSVAKLPPVSTTPAVQVAKFTSDVVDTCGAPWLANISENFRQNLKWS